MIENIMPYRNAVAPLVNNRKLFKEFLYQDRGNIDNGISFVSRYVIDGKQFDNAVSIPSECGNPSSYRFHSDCAFCESLGFDITGVLFEGEVDYGKIQE